MKIKIFNATQKEIESKQYNIFIGISIGVKPINEKLAEDYILWALKYTKNKVVILIADEIAKINYKIFSKYSTSKAHKRAIREGDKYVNFFNKVLTNFSNEEKNRVIILRWDEIFNDELRKIKDILEKESDNNPEFKKYIINFVAKFAQRKGKDLNEKQLDNLLKYVLFELPTLLNGIEFKGIKYRLLLYPTFVESGMSKFVADIEGGNIFQKLKNKLNLTDKTILVEANLR